MAKSKTKQTFINERCRFQKSGGVSENNADFAFRPAFFDSIATIYASRSADGQCVPYHCLDGLPGTLVTRRDDRGHVIGVQPGVVAGFVRDGKFYTREEAAQAVERASRTHDDNDTCQQLRNRKPLEEHWPGLGLPLLWTAYIVDTGFRTWHLGWSTAVSLPLRVAKVWSRTE